MLHEGRADFRQILGEKYANLLMPWKNGGDYLKSNANLYFHCLARKSEILMSELSEGGWGSMFQQAWDCCYQKAGFPEPVYGRFLRENMCYLPNTHQMMKSEMEDMAAICRKHLDEHHSDGKPARPKELE